MSGIFVMDGSKRSRHSNAYFTGLGAVKRIVLFDTLVSQMSEDGVLAVLAHEIGHEKKRHVLKGSIVSIALSFVAFWILDLFMNWGALYAAFGFVAPSKHALLLILALVSGPATFFLAPGLLGVVAEARVRGRRLSPPGSRHRGARLGLDPAEPGERLELLAPPAVLGLVLFAPDSAREARRDTEGQPMSTDRKLPAGSLNQAMSGPRPAALPRAMPFASVFGSPS